MFFGRSRIVTGGKAHITGATGAIETRPACFCNRERPIGYSAELLRNWRPLLAATFGLGTGSAAISLYTASIVAPRMITELAWSKSDYALLGMLGLVLAFFFPVAGRLADIWGVRRTVVLGIVALPLSLFAYSLMTGPIWQYVAINLAAGVLCITTTASVYSRVAVQHAERSRGMALAIVASGPAATGVLIAPVFNALVEAEGWRTTYQALAVYAAVAGVVTLLILPSDKPSPAAGPAQRRRARHDYPAIFRSRPFWILLVAMLACNLPHILAMSQMKLVLMENGVSARGTSVMLAAVPAGVLLGRFVVGYALDRYPAPVVGFVGMALPALGLSLIASSFDAPAVLTFASLCLGFSVGAEGDVLAFVVAQQFGLEVYSSVMGLLTMAISLSVAMGAGILSLTLRMTDHFNAFVVVCAISVFAGGALFLLVPSTAAVRRPDHREI